MCTKLSWHPYKKLRVSSVLLSWIAPDMSRSHLITIANGIVAISQAQVGLVFCVALHSCATSSSNQLHLSSALTARVYGSSGSKDSALTQWITGDSPEEIHRNPEKQQNYQRGSTLLRILAPLFAANSIQAAQVASFAKVLHGCRSDIDHMPAGPML